MISKKEKEDSGEYKKIKSEKLRMENKKWKI